MYSRIIAILIAVNTLLIGCSLPLGEDPLVAKPIDVSLGDSSGCFSKVVPVLEKYFEGEAQDSQIEATWNCVSTTLGTFEKSVEGRYEDRFTARELAHFIEQYFLEDGQLISDSLMTEVFRIKQLFVGGSVDYITRQEIKILDKVVHELKDITVELNPHMKIFSMNWKIQTVPMRDVDLDMFEAANEGIQKAAKKLAIIIERNGMAYDIANFANLLKELSALSSKGWAWISDVETAIPLVKKLKKTLAGGDESQIAPKEWRRFALLGARGFVQYLRYHYFIKEASIKEGGAHLAYFIRSVDDLFSYLGDMVDGKPDQLLTRQELLEICQSLATLIPDLKVSDQLILEIMRIKVVFFGGRVDFFVKADFERARAKLEEFRQITQKFLDYRDVFGQDWVTAGLAYTQTFPKFKLAEKNIVEVARRLGQIMETRYDLNNLISLAEEVEKLYPTTDKDATPLDKMARQYVPVLVSIKNILFTDETTIIGGAGNISPTDQWSEYLELGGQFYCRYLTYFYFLKGNEIETANVLMGTERLVYDSVAILDRIIKRKPDLAISWKELDALSVNLIKTEMLPDLLKAETLSKTLRTLLGKVLVSPEERLAGYKAIGLSAKATQVIKSEFALWSENQRFFEIAFSGSDPLVGITEQEIVSDIEKMTPTVALLELKMIFHARLPMSYDEQNRLYLAKPAKNYRKKTATIFNMIRSGARLLVRSFAGEIDRVTGYIGINEKETNELYLELRDILSEFELVHPKNDDFGVNRFRDAGLFTDIGNGDLHAGFSEISHLFMMIMSGLELDSMTYDPIEQAKGCNLDKKNSVYKDDWESEVKCITDIYYLEMPKYFLNVPEFMAFQAKLDRPRFDKMFLNLLVAAGHSEKNGNKLIVGDLSLVPHIIQYIETYFQLYDADKNGIIETPEALQSYTVYESILRQVSGLKSEKELKGLLTWMLKYGRPPETMGEKLKFATWWVPKGEKGWVVAAERDQLASILSFISKAIEDAKQKSIEEAKDKDKPDDGNNGP